MKSPEELRTENRVLRERISQLSAASLRISASLDVNTVLRQVVKRARSLTRSRFGAIVTIDDSGQIQEFVTSGITPEEKQGMANWPDGPRLFAHFRDLPGALRVRDMPGYVESLLGYCPPQILAKAFQGTPLRYRGIHVGNFFLPGLFMDQVDKGF